MRVRRESGRDDLSSPRVYPGDQNHIALCARNNEGREEKRLLFVCSIRLPRGLEEEMFKVKTLAV